MSSETLESQLIANVLRELQKTPLTAAWVRDPALLADARKYGAEEAVRCLYLPRHVAECHCQHGPPLTAFTATLEARPMPLRIAPFQPSNEDKARINAVAEAIALNRLYRPVSAPLVSSSTRALVQAAAEEVGADPLPVRAPQQRVSETGAQAEKHGREYVRLVRAVLREVALGRGGQPLAQQLAEQAQRHEALMRAASGEDKTRRQHDGDLYSFRDGLGSWAFELNLRYSEYHGHLWPARHGSNVLGELDDDALVSLGRWCSSVSPEERAAPGRVADSGELIYREHKSSLELRASIASRYPGLAHALHLLALSAWPVEVSPLSG